MRTDQSPKSRKRIASSNSPLAETPGTSDLKHLTGRKGDKSPKSMPAKIARLEKPKGKIKVTTITIPEDDRFMQMTVQDGEELDYGKDSETSEADHEISFRNSQSSELNDNSTDERSNDEENDQLSASEEEDLSQDESDSGPR